LLDASEKYILNSAPFIDALKNWLQDINVPFRFRKFFPRDT